MQFDFSEYYVHDIVVCFFLLDCDIRSCLNTLQFLHKKKEPLNVVWKLLILIEYRTY